jgi:rod shape-determining protein MreD
MSASATLRAGVLVFLAALLQVTIVSSLAAGGGSPDLLLLVVVCLALQRGAIAGAIAGFAGGLVIDLLSLDTLGVTSLVLTLAGFWAGRYGETTARGHRFAPVVAVGVITVLAGIFGFVLRFMLGDEVVAQQALVTALLPTAALNLALAMPVHWLVRRAVGVPPIVAPPEVEVLV